MRKAKLWATGLVSCLLATAAFPDSGVRENPANGHRYQRIDELLVWQDAKLYCEDLGGYLTSITSEDENDFVRAFPRTTQIWLGGTDERIEGTWEWVSGEPWGYSNWAPGEPNNLYPEHYLIMHSGATGLWNDYRGIVPRPFVCEWEAQPMPTLPRAGLVLLALALIAAGALALRRRTSGV